MEKLLDTVVVLNYSYNILERHDRSIWSCMCVVCKPYIKVCRSTSIVCVLYTRKWRKERSIVDHLNETESNTVCIENYRANEPVVRVNWNIVIFFLIYGAGFVLHIPMVIVVVIKYLNMQRIDEIKKKSTLKLDIGYIGLNFHIGANGWFNLIVTCVNM